MSSQKGNASRSRGQRYQNSVSFRNDKYGATVQVKVREPHANFLSLAALSGLCFQMNFTTEGVYLEMSSNKYHPCCYRCFTFSALVLILT